MTQKPRRGWDPITIHPINPDSPSAQAFRERPNGCFWEYRDPRAKVVDVKAFSNRLYNGIIFYFADGAMHLDFKRNDRSAVRDWRHFQAIKNEVAGPEREAIEIFPAEDNLLDGANQYHLWVLPPGVHAALGFAGPADVLPAHDTMDRAQYASRTRAGVPTAAPGSVQRPWESGIPTGLGRDEETS